MQKLMKLSSWRLPGHTEMRSGEGEHIRGNVVAQGSLLEGGLQQDPSNTTKKEAVAERNA